VHKPLHRYLQLQGYPKTEAAWKETLSIPIYPGLSNEDADLVIRLLLETLREVETP